MRCPAARAGWWSSGAPAAEGGLRLAVTDDRGGRTARARDVGLAAGWDAATAPTGRDGSGIWRSAERYFRSALARRRRNAVSLMQPSASRWLYTWSASTVPCASRLGPFV